MESDIIDIDDSFNGYSTNLFCVPDHYMDSISGVLIPHGLIQERVKKIARDILKDVLDENYACAEDPSKNICLDAENLTLTKEQEEFTILDLLSEDQNCFDDLLDISETSLGEEKVPKRSSVILENTWKEDSSMKLLQPLIHVKSFARQSFKKESLHFLCILKAQASQVEILRRMNYPSVKGGYKFFLDLLDQVNKFNASRSKTSIQVNVDFIRVGRGIHQNDIVIEGIDNIESLRESNVVIVEDVVDTGSTMNQLVNKLNMFSPKRILIACLLKKRRPDY